MVTRRNRKQIRKQIDPIEQAMETALDHGNFISYNAAWAFVNGVQQVANNIEKIIGKEPDRAARLYETFIGACHDKAEEIDDSSGSFGMMVDSLFHGWIKARQAAGAEADETAEALLAWMEDDPYGFCYDLDREAAKVLDRRGLEAFVLRIRTKFASVPIQDEKARYPGYERRKWGDALKTLLAAQRNVDAYIALCEETELGGKECKIIAEMYLRLKHPEKALAWVERGLEITRSDRRSFGDHELREMKRALLAKLGQAGDALQSAWSEYEDNPSTFTYKELMRYVPAGAKKVWHEKAMAASEKGALANQIELWLEKKEIERLVSRLRGTADEKLEKISHFTGEPLARRLERSHPDIAARIYRALCMRIVNAGKSRYYDAAIDNLAHAKKCYMKAGLEADWQALVAEVRGRHSRKYGFMARFEDVVSGPRKGTREGSLQIRGCIV